MDKADHTNEEQRVAAGERIILVKPVCPRDVTQDALRILKRELSSRQARLIENENRMRQKKG